jgi:hypothetical protein
LTYFSREGKDLHEEGVRGEEDNKSLAEETGVRKKGWVTLP